MQNNFNWLAILPILISLFGLIGSYKKKEVKKTGILYGIIIVLCLASISAGAVKTILAAVGIFGLMIAIYRSIQSSS